MRTFADNAGRTWTIAINADSIRRIRAVLDVDLLEAPDGQLIERLSRDPILLCDIVYVACKPEAEQRNISDEEFGRAMAGDAIDHATTSLLEELVDFFPKAHQRKVVNRVIETFKVLETRAGNMAIKRLEDPKLIEQAEAEIERRMSGDSFGNSPESSDSTPDPLHSVN